MNTMTRRTVVRAGLWGVPAITAAAAAPAYATSGPKGPKCNPKVTYEKCGKEYEYSINPRSSHPVVAIYANGAKVKPSASGFRWYSRKVEKTLTLLIRTTAGDWEGVVVPTKKSGR